MEIQRSTTDDEAINRYLALFGVCFPTATIFTKEYLKWLYAENPDGHVFGFDAFVDGKLVAHAASVPFKTMFRGQTRKALIALNVATHPSQRGKGLFTKLAANICNAAAKDDFECVIGVANDQALPGWKKLNFQSVKLLEARLGFGRFPKADPKKIINEASFYRIWDEERLSWRIRCPGRPLRILADPKGSSTTILGKTKYNVDVQAELPLVDLPARGKNKFSSILRLSLGLEPAGSCDYGFSLNIPQKMRPAMLQFIYKNLHDESDNLDPDGIHFTFIDFDTY